MASKIYLLLDGPGDERNICAVFSTREAAEAALVLADEDGEVQEHVVDGPLMDAPPGHSLWHVQWYQAEYIAIRLSAFLLDEELDSVQSEEDDVLKVQVWARDEEHALALGMALIEQAKK